MLTGTLVLLRYDPEIDAEPHREKYQFPFEPGMTVLDVVRYVHDRVDGTLSFSYSCRTSHCGLCGAMINGVAGLMCREPATLELLLEPLKGFQVVRDLMIDREDHEEINSGLRLYLDRVNVPELQPETIAAEDLSMFRQASRCVECFCCSASCPAVFDGQHEFIGPSGIVQLARHAFDPRDQSNRGLMAYSSGLYNCTTCGICSEVCPQDVGPAEIVERLRARLIASAQVPRSVELLACLVGDTEYAMERPRTTFLDRHANSSKARVGLFVGCSIDRRASFMPIARAAVGVMESLGVEVAIPRDQVCCGYPLWEVGAREELNQLVQKNVRVFREAGCTHLVTLCPACGLGAKTIWPEVLAESAGEEMPLTVEDFTEFFVRVRSLPVGSSDSTLRVVYHDPCLLKRGQGIFEEPRQLLRMLRNVDFTDMDGADHCCGGGGGLSLYNPDLAQRILRRKTDLLRTRQLDAIVTGCPTCIRQLRSGVAQGGLRGVEVIHPAVLAARAMGIP